MKSIRYSQDALAALKRHRNVASRIVEKIEFYAASGAGDVKKLVGSPSKRLRIGDYRVIFEEDALEMRVSQIAPRSEIYR